MGEWNHEASAQQHADELLAALVELVSAWSSPAVQARIAQRIGLDINESDIRSLHTIGRLGPVRPAALAAELHLSRPTVSKSLARLGAAGLIERREVERDLRASEIELSETGRDAYDRLAAVGVDMVEHALAEASASRIDASAFVHFTRALRAMAAPRAGEAILAADQPPTEPGV